MIPITIVAPATSSSPPAVLCSARPGALLTDICGSSFAVEITVLLPATCGPRGRERPCRPDTDAMGGGDPGLGPIGPWVLGQAPLASGADRGNAEGERYGCRPPDRAAGDGPSRRMVR